MSTQTGAPIDTRAYRASIVLQAHGLALRVTRPFFGPPRRVLLMSVGAGGGRESSHVLHATCYALRS